MKKYFNIILTVIFCSILIKAPYGQELKSQKIAEANILADQPTAAGTKIIYPIKGEL
ncbi:MAG: hypothetical protein ACHQF0_10570 [Chitinophagales bacterium]